MGSTSLRLGSKSGFFPGGEDKKMGGIGSLRTPSSGLLRYDQGLAEKPRYSF
jgi:hypothetical protein